MDGRVPCLDDTLIERLNTRRFYLRDYTRVAEPRTDVGTWFRFYSHQSEGRALQGWNADSRPEWPWRLRSPN